jgi:hypothetical protein
LQPFGSEPGVYGLKELAGGVEGGVEQSDQRFACSDSLTTDGCAGEGRAQEDVSPGESRTAHL